MILQTYLNFGGNCREAFEFYAASLNGTITALMPHTGELSGVMHARLSLGQTELLGSDVPDGRWQPMRSAYISLSLDSTPEAERVFAALAAGGEIFMPIQETFFAHRFAMLRDRFGINWMILHERPAPPQN